MTDRARSSALPETESPKVRQKTSETAPPHQAQRQREPQVFGSSPVKPKPSKSQAEAGQRRQPGSAKSEGRLIREQESGGAPSVTFEDSQERQSQVKVVGPSPVKTRSSRLQAEVSRPRPPAFRKTEPQQVGTKAWEGAPSVSSQTAKQRQRGSQAAGPSTSGPESSVHQTKLKDPSAPVLLGEPANRLSPSRAERSWQQRPGTPQERGHK
jgi:hypothetical protein